MEVEQRQQESTRALYAEYEQWHARETSTMSAHGMLAEDSNPVIIRMLARFTSAMVDILTDRPNPQIPTAEQYRQAMAWMYAAHGTY